MIFKSVLTLYCSVHTFLIANSFDTQYIIIKHTLFFWNVVLALYCESTLTKAVCVLFFTFLFMTFDKIISLIKLAVIEITVLHT